MSKSPSESMKTAKTLWQQLISQIRIPQTSDTNQNNNDPINPRTPTSTRETIPTTTQNTPNQPTTSLQAPPDTEYPTTQHLPTKVPPTALSTQTQTTPSRKPETPTFETIGQRIRRGLRIRTTEPKPPQTPTPTNQTNHQEPSTSAPLPQPTIWQRYMTSNAPDRNLHPTNATKTRTRRPILLSPENVKQNTVYGDTLQAKPPHTTRAYSMNPNGIYLDQTGGDMTTLCKISQEVEADILLQYEINLDTTKPKVNYLLRKAVNSLNWHTGKPKLTVASSPLPAKNF